MGFLKYVLRPHPKNGAVVYLKQAPDTYFLKAADILRSCKQLAYMVTRPILHF